MKTVIVDDDPTGTQSSCDVRVFLRADTDLARWEPRLSPRAMGMVPASARTVSTRSAGRQRGWVQWLRSAETSLGLVIDE